MECEVILLLKDMTNMFKSTPALLLCHVAVENTESMGLYFLFQVIQNVLFIFRMVINKRFSDVHVENTYSVNFLND